MYKNNFFNICSVFQIIWTSHNLKIKILSELNSKSANPCPCSSRIHVGNIVLFSHSHVTVSIRKSESISLIQVAVASCKSSSVVGKIAYHCGRVLGCSPAWFECHSRSVLGISIHWESVQIVPKESSGTWGVWAGKACSRNLFKNTFLKLSSRLSQSC